MTSCANVLVESNFFSLELTLFGAKGGRVNLGLGGPFQKSPTVKKSRPEGLVFFDIVGKIPSCSDQVDEVREEQSAVGVARPCFESG